MASSPEQIFARKAAIVGLTDVVLVALCDGSLTTTRVSRAKNGLETFDYKEIAVLESLLSELEELKRRASPFSVPWNDVRAVRQLLNDLRKQRACPPAPLSPSEAELLKQFAASVDISELAERYKTSREGLLDRIEGLLDRTARRVEVAGDPVIAMK